MNRPQATDIASSGASPLYPRFSQQEYQRRYQALWSLMNEEHVRCLIVYGNSASARHGQAHIHYLANFLGRQEAYLLFPLQSEPVLFVQYFNHLPNARRVAVIEDTRWGGPDSALAVAEEIARRGLGQGRIGLVGSVPYQAYQRLQKALPHTTLLDLTSRFLNLRLIKSEEELLWMRRAAGLTDAAMEALAKGARPGMAEYELTAIVDGAALSRYGQPHLAYMCSTPMRSPDRCLPAQDLSSRPLQRGDLILTEISVAYWGYSGQILRPLALGQGPPRKLLRLYEVALEAYEHITSAIRPGATEQDVLEAASCIHTAGYTIYDDLVHGFGGGYLPPIIRTRETSHNGVAPLTFRENMTVVVQPNVITEDETMGVQLGNLVLVTARGCESLQGYPMCFIVTP